MARPPSKEKRDAILRAAQQVFSTCGYRDASVDEVARVAGVSKRTIYRHYADKRDLFETVCGRLWEKVLERPEVDYQRHAGFRERLRAFADAKLQVLLHPHVIVQLRMVLTEMLRDPLLGKRMVELLVEELDHALPRMLQEEHASGRVHITSPRVTALFFYGMVKEVLFWPVVLGAKPGGFSRAYRERVLDEVVDILATFYEQRAGRSAAAAAQPAPPRSRGRPRPGRGPRG